MGMKKTKHKKRLSPKQMTLLRGRNVLAWRKMIWYEKNALALIKRETERMIKYGQMV